MSNPIATMIAGAPTSAQILSDPAEPRYDATAPDPVEAGTPPPVAGPAFNGFFSKEVDDNLDGDASATLTILPSDLPASYVAGKSRVQVQDEIFIIRGHRVRRWLGQVNGYTLQLGL
ncbi:MAG: hypothetical protein KKA05_10455 [Alphaproteobacteria bacterium]|nr:hypothetical protein [Alphaproteobacteria bacterium]